MKKHLIAAAVAAAVAIPAVAQVTVSGRIDTSYGAAKNQADQGTSRISSSVLTSNQLSFTGSEDLGGGLKAGFAIHSGFSSDANAAISFGDRGMQVGVSGGFGEIAIGKTTGTMLNSTTASGVTGNIGNLSTLVARPNNMISYTSPSISGFTLRGIMDVGSETKPTTGKQTEISAQYSSGPLLARIARADYKTVAIAAGTSSSSNIFGTSSTSSALTDTKVEETGAQVDYDLGFAKANLRFQKRDHSAAANLAKDFDSFGIGASFPLASGLSINVDYVDVDSSTNTSDNTVTSATVVKSFSKRTNVYLAIASKDTNNTAVKKESLTAVGVRHSF